MKVVSSRMKDAVNKAIKGAGFNNLIPMTSMIGIKLEGGKLRLFTTDMTNTLCIIIDKVSGVDMDITVDADKFGKLIAKTTSEDIELLALPISHSFGLGRLRCVLAKGATLFHL